MDNPAPLRLLATTNNERGDRFTRLVKDLFFALGYDDQRLDVADAGREVDIQGTHRLEPRRFVAECKAHAARMGGDDLNKFLGVLTRERGQSRGMPVAGYFVSLGGFRESARLQEERTGEQDRIILLDGKQVIEELTGARILIKQADAVEKAGRVAAQVVAADAAVDGVELLGHEIGYVWAVYYARGKARTHFALIHADGTPLEGSAAQGVIAADRDAGGCLHELAYLAPTPPAPDRLALAAESAERYRRWLIAECGYIQLDGLPADTDLHAMRLRLERLFVPLKVEVGAPPGSGGHPMDLVYRTLPVGEFLAEFPRFALLAKPGGGKSTLLKRLAVAYADPARRAETDDGLPDRDWLPLFLRCRELRERAHRPVRELLDDLAQHAGLNGPEAAAFRERIDEALRAGRAILLVDGLDEIADEGTRRIFADHLRTFLAMFPTAAMVVTSREAGYRHVAGVIAGSCERARLAPFDVIDVFRLCESWHVEVVGDTEKIRADARQLAETIWSNERICALAANPLMLTTLLVVRRCCGGELPTRRVELYGEAVKVLIRTWNTQGFEPMNLEEALARLSYVACVMMERGQQQIGHEDLLERLHQARDELQAELQLSRISPADFIERVEYRSSLLMQVGQERIDGRLQPLYEFRHLTFQEYLAARGLVEEQYPGRDAGKSLVELLEPHFEDERWREVIPLAAVLAGRRAEPLVQRLTALCQGLVLEGSLASDSDLKHPVVALLRQCLLDEVKVAPVTLRAALRLVARFGDETSVEGSVLSLRRGKFGDVFQDAAEEAYFGRCDDWHQFTLTVAYVALEAFFQERPRELSGDAAEMLRQQLDSGDRIHVARAALVCALLAYQSRDARDSDRAALVGRFRPLTAALCRALSIEDRASILAVVAAIAGIGVHGFADEPLPAETMRSLFRFWRTGDSELLRDFASTALAAQPLRPRDALSGEMSDDGDGFEPTPENSDRPAWAVLEWYRLRPATDSELVERLRKINYDHHDYFRPIARQMAAALGEDGRRLLEEWDNQPEEPARPWAVNAPPPAGAG